MAMLRSQVLLCRESSLRRTAGAWLRGTNRQSEEAKFHHTLRLARPRFHQIQLKSDTENTP